MVTDLLTNRLAAAAPSRLSLLRLQPSRAFLAYAISTFTHAVILGGLAVWMPGDYEGGSFSMLSGNGGIGNNYSPIGSEGGATTSEVFYFEMPAISNLAEMAEYRAPNFAELAAQEQESRVTAETPTVSAVAITRQKEAESSVATDIRSMSIDELTSRAEVPSSEVERKQERARPEATEPIESPAELPAARNIAVAPTLTGAKILVDLAENAREGETTGEKLEVTATQITRREAAEQLTAATAATPPPNIEPVETRAKPTDIEIERKQEPSAPQLPPTETPDTPPNLPIYRSIAAAPAVGEVEVELPAVTVSNGRGQDGLGTGNTEGDGNGGARGKIGGDFESPGIGPNNPSPVYPPELDQAGVDGKVIVRVKISAEGTVDSAEVAVSSGWKSFDEAAVKAIRKWRFSPARRYGVPVTTEVKIPVDFWYRRR